MNIQWFPGHMTKSLREMETATKAVDFVVYVLDARAPFACINPEFDRLFANMPIIFVLNKADIAPQQSIDRFTNKMIVDNQSNATNNKAVITMDSTQSGSAKAIASIAKNLCKTKIDKYRAKGVKISLCGIVVGVPNVGKSTLINNLVGKKKATTGNRPGVTRAIQSIKIDEYLEIKDSPGTLYPKFDNQQVAIKLAIIGSIRDAVLDSIELSKELLQFLCRDHLQVLTDRYKIDSQDTFETAITKIAQKRGYLLKGGIIDEEKAATAVIEDFRKGYFGKIGLE